MHPSKREQLLELASGKDTNFGWWFFPTEDVVQGFLGTSQIFMVGIRPSTEIKNNRNCRIFYDLLAKIGAPDIHLTDIYKRPARSEETEIESETDFQEHLLFFRKELEILNPTKVIALGNDARTRLRWHLPNLEPIATDVWHYRYAIRTGKLSEYERRLRAAIEGA
ncbi:MAG: hypothetical protein M3362_06430 [Acidobacteriota bacterium]|nr:hypothetical protein [Acidobacteriota bacterium]